MLTPHTPGPWHYEDGPEPADITERYLTVLGPDSHGHAHVTVNGGGWNGGGGAAEGNARLIAAAPDLLEACKSFVAYQIRCNQQKTTKHHKQAIAAIVKAEGEDAAVRYVRHAMQSINSVESEEG